MLLSDNFVKQVCNYSELKKYNVKKEKVTNVYYRIYLESDNIIIQLDIEEMESYVSFLITHYTEGSKKYYYALTDYFEIIDNKLSTFVTKIEDEIFKQNVKNAIKKRQKIFSQDKNGDDIVYCIYTYINDFVKKILLT